MAKGLRAKTEKRKRSARRQHYYEVQGKFELAELSRRLNDPHYVPPPQPPNAFLHPTNPDAVFPQHKKPHMVDFRMDRMALGGFTSRGLSHKEMSVRAIKSKYKTSFRSDEMIKEDEELEKKKAELME